MTSVIDSFEDGDIAEWSGQTGSFTTTTEDAYKGSYGVEPTESDSALTRTDTTVSPNTTPFGLWYYANNYQGDFGTVYASRNGGLFAVQSNSGYSSVTGYGIIDSYDSSTTVAFEIVRWDDGSRTTLSTFGSVPAAEWYKFEISSWTTSGDITVDVYDTSNTKVASSTVTDDTYGSGGVGFMAQRPVSTVQTAVDYYYKSIPLSPPSNVQVTDSSTEGQLTIDWDSVSNANGYYIYRGQSSGSSKSDYVRVGDVRSSTFTNNKLQDGEKYYYRVSSHEKGKGLFESSYSWEITSGSPTIDSSTGNITNLKSDGTGGTDNRVTFRYSDIKHPINVEYTQTSSPPESYFDDRYHSILQLKRSDGNIIFDINIAGNNEIHVYDPVDTNQGYQDRRDNNYGTGINGSGTYTFNISWDGSAWYLDIDSGSYTRTMDGMNDPINEIKLAEQGTSDNYVEGVHGYDLKDLDK